jgi:signal transduction histidine kinase
MSVQEADPRGALHRALQKYADKIGACGVAIYETGHSLPSRSVAPRPTADRSWSGNLYFIDSLPPGPEIGTVPGELQGYPASLDAQGLDDLHRVIDGERRTAVVTNPGVVRGALARAGAKAVLAVRVMLDERFVTLLVFYFTDLAATEVARKHRLIDELEERFAPLRQGIAEHAAGVLLERFTQLLEALGGCAEAGTKGRFPLAFDTTARAELAKLAEDIRCPDLRVYLLDDANPRDPRAVPLSPESTTPERYRLHYPADTMEFVDSTDSGPVGWVLRNGRRLALHNRDSLSQEWIDGAGQQLYAELTRLQSFGVDADGQVVPLLAQNREAGFCASLLVHPLMVGTQMMGVVVANGHLGPPFVFRQWDDKGMAVVAQMLGSHWLAVQTRWLERRESERRATTAAALRGFSAGMAEALRKGAVEDDTLFSLALDAAGRIAEGADLITLRVYDAAALGFRFNASLARGADARDAGVRGLLMDPRHLYPFAPGVPEEARSAAEYVARLGQPAIVDFARPARWFRDSFGRRYRHGIYVPVLRGGTLERPAAVLDIRSKGPEPMPGGVAEAAQELADLLGLAATSSDSRRALQKTEQAHVQTFEDIAHQILTPQRGVRHHVLRALRLSRQVEDSSLRERLAHALLVARGQIRRAIRVGLLGPMFAELSRTGEIGMPADATALTREDVLEALRYLVDDERTLLDPRRRLTFRIDEDAIAEAYRGEIVGDRAMFEQMVANLIENAAKYSLPGTLVWVTGGRVTNDMFMLEVANYGQDIRPDDVGRLRQRGERGLDSGLRVGSGHGIGLFLVDAIAKAFGAHHDIVPGRGRAEPHRFRLRFPSRG